MRFFSVLPLPPIISSAVRFSRVISTSTFLNVTVSDGSNVRPRRVH